MFSSQTRQALRVLWWRFADHVEDGARWVARKPRVAPTSSVPKLSELDLDRLIDASLTNDRIVDMTNTATTSIVDYSNTSVATLVEQEHRGVIIPEAVIVSAGEYQAQGEPDLLVTVNHAITAEGHDVRKCVARALRSYIGSPEFAARVTDFAACEGVTE